MKSRIKTLITIVAFIIPTLSGIPVSAETFDGEISISKNEIAGTFSKGYFSNSDRSKNSGQLLSDGPGFKISSGKIDTNSFQILITIENNTAKNRFKFKLAENFHIEPLKANDVEIYRLTNQRTGDVSWLASPWARDAKGTDVPTHFVFTKNTITQYVDLSNENLTYPITADPYLGIDLISSVSVKSYATYKTMKIAVTPWLGVQYSALPIANWTYGTAVLIAQNFGWSEVLTKVGDKYGSGTKNYIVDRPTFKYQWDCHALGAPAIFFSSLLGIDTNPTWDLEGNRPANSNIATWPTTQCNW